jgi:hypothetical protein
LRWAQVRRRPAGPAEPDKLRDDAAPYANYGNRVPNAEQLNLDTAEKEFFHGYWARRDKASTPLRRAGVGSRVRKRGCVGSLRNHPTAAQYAS